MTMFDPSAYARVGRGSDEVIHSTTRVVFAGSVVRSSSVLKVMVEFATTALDVEFVKAVKFEFVGVARERLGNARILH